MPDQSGPGRVSQPLPDSGRVPPRETRLRSSDEVLQGNIDMGPLVIEGEIRACDRRAARTATQLSPTSTPGGPLQGTLFLVDSKGAVHTVFQATNRFSLCGFANNAFYYFSSSGSPRLRRHSLTDGSDVQVGDAPFHGPNVVTEKVIAGNVAETSIALLLDATTGAELARITTPPSALPAPNYAYPVGIHGDRVYILRDDATLVRADLDGSCLTTVHATAAGETWGGMVADDRGAYVMLASKIYELVDP